MNDNLLELIVYQFLFQRINHKMINVEVSVRRCCLEHLIASIINETYANCVV